MPSPHRTSIEITAPGQLASHTTRLLADGHRLALVAAHHDGADTPSGPALRVVYLFLAGPPSRATELVLRTDPTDPRVPSLAAISFPASRFEREMRDLYGIEPEHHPMPRPLVHHPHWPQGWFPMRHDCGPRPTLAPGAPFPFLTVEGEGVYEIPVGPVHAGLIEPGHFRFSVVGETILKLKARLWYVHKGVEKLFEGRTVEQGVALAERISGDTAIGHAVAYCQAVEDALQIEVPPEAARMRAVLLELERLHNHVADVGALCNDVGYGIANAHTQRIRERLLRLNQRVTGHRLLRGGVFPGGAVLRAVPQPDEIEAVATDLAEIIEIALGNSVVRERFTGTAVLTRQQAADVGAVGYVAKASGIGDDARISHPSVELTEQLRLPAETGGDVLARFLVRAGEARTSSALIRQWGTRLTAARSGRPYDAAVGRGSGVGVAEGWRGTIVHRVELARDGRLSRVKVVDPSFLNWPALPLAMADTIVPDFPLANKSFNLSYAGNDL